MEKSAWVRLWVIVGFVIGAVAIILAIFKVWPITLATFWLAIAIFTASVVSSILS